MLQLSPFFPLTVIPRCFNIYSFISRFTGSFVEILRPRAGPDDGYAASILCFHTAQLPLAMYFVLLTCAHNHYQYWHYPLSYFTLSPPKVYCPELRGSAVV